MPPRRREKKREKQGSVLLFVLPVGKEEEYVEKNGVFQRNIRNDTRRVSITMTIYIFRHLPMGTHGNWNAHGNPWELECPWVSMGAHGNPWGCPWEPMGTRGNSWASPWQPMSIPMGSHGNFRRGPLHGFPRQTHGNSHGQSNLPHGESPVTAHVQFPL